MLTKDGLIRGYSKISDRQSEYSGGGFINEGVTEELNCIKDNLTHYGPGTDYPLPRLVAQFMLGNQRKGNNLIEAFLSDSVRDIETFEQDFNSKAEGIEYSSVERLGAYDKPTDEHFTSMLKGAISYRIKSCKSREELEEQFSYYSGLIERVRTSEALGLAFEDFLDTLSSELSEHLDNKKKEMQDNIVNREQTDSASKTDSFIESMQGQCATDSEFAQYVENEGTNVTISKQDIEKS